MRLTKVRGRVRVVGNGLPVHETTGPATAEYPYTLGCFHGTPLRLPRPR